MFLDSDTKRMSVSKETFHCVLVCVYYQAHCVEVLGFEPGLQ